VPSPAAGAVITYDADVPAFGVRITTRDVRSFVLNYVVNGRERRMTIGRFPTWSATAAREEAKDLWRKVESKIDPLEEQAAQEHAAKAARAAPTMWDLFDRYAAEHLPRKAARSASDDRSIWQKLVLPRLGSTKVDAVQPSDIDVLHAEVSLTRPVRANRMVEIIRKAFNLAARWGWRSDNSAIGVHRNREEKRARYLSASEILRLSQVLAMHPERTSAYAIRFLMLTGARRNEALSGPLGYV
jgi:integrase